MLRSSLIAAGAVILCSAAAAQTGIRTATPMQSAAKFGGTFHVATGTWTRNVPTTAARGTGDVIYNNTADSGVFTSQTDQTESYQIVDAGRIPTTGSAGTANRDNYNITDVTLGYCIDGNTANSADVLVTIYGSYSPCEDPALHTCSGQFLGTGLPGAATAGVIACWIVNFDLSGGGEICLLGDGDGVFDSDLDFDSFGVGYEFDPGGLGGYVGSGIAFGPIIAGDRNWTVQATGELTASAGAGVAGCATAATGGGADTYYGPAECCVPAVAGDNSTGLDNNDLAWIGFGAASGLNPGCYWFGGYNNTVSCQAATAVYGTGVGYDTPHMGLYSNLTADLSTNCVPTDCTTTGAGTPFCDPGNNNSTGAPAVLTGNFGSGTGSDLHLDVSGGPLPIGGSRMLGYYLVGNMATPGVVISDGNFCLVGVAGASFGRYNVAGTDRNSISLFDAAGNLQNFVGTGGGTGYGYDVPTTVIIAGQAPTVTTGGTFHFQCWYRDTLAGSGNSNFSNGYSVTFP